MDGSRNKRAVRDSRNDDSADVTKRAKLTATARPAPSTQPDKSYDVVLDGTRFVDVDRLFKSPPLAAFFNKRYKRSVTRLIQETTLQVVYVTKQDAAQGLLRVKSSYSPKADVRVVQYCARVDELIAEASGHSPQLAPPVIQDTDLAFFVDKAGTRHFVEMRGERTMERIYFRAKDVGTVFASDRFVETLQDLRCSYQETTDFVWFTVIGSERSDGVSDRGSRTEVASSSVNGSAAHTSQKKKHPTRRELFLTFAGLMHALHSTRSPVANEFRAWIYTQVFAIAYGTEDQKKAMVHELCRVDKRFLEAFMKLVPNDVACLYLLDTNKREQGKRVLKFGRSTNVKDRFYKHSATFGDDCLLDTIVFVPGDQLSQAEARLNHMIADAFRYEWGNARELLLLGSSDYKAVRACMQTIADKYNGSLAVHSRILDGEVKDVESAMREQELRYELRINHLERMLEVVDERARADVSDERHRVAVLEQQLTAATQRLDAATIQLQQQLETATLRLQVQQLQHAAMVADKDRRIAELEQQSFQAEATTRQDTEP